MRNAAKKGAARRTAADAHNGAVPTRVLLRAGLAGVCVAAAVASIITYASYEGLKDAFTTVGRTNNFARALREFRASNSVLDPNSYRDGGIAVALLHSGHPVQAERTMADAARREPDNYQAWYVLTRIQVARGRLAAARASYAQVRRLDPHALPQLPPPA